MSDDTDTPTAGGQLDADDDRWLGALRYLRFAAEPVDHLREEAYQQVQAEVRRLRSELRAAGNANHRALLVMNAVVSSPVCHPHNAIMLREGIADLHTAEARGSVPVAEAQPVGYVWWSTQGIQWGGPEGTGHRTERPVYLASESVPAAEGDLRERVKAAITGAYCTEPPGIIERATDAVLAVLPRGSRPGKQPSPPELELPATESNSRAEEE